MGVLVFDRHNGVTDGYVPWHRGFEEACMVDLYDYYDNYAVCNGHQNFQQGWTNERIFDWSIDFMQRKKDEKFLLYIPLMTPHLGKTWYGEGEAWHAPEQVISKYQNKGLSYHLARLYASIDFMDYNVGRLLNHMNTLGIADNTVVVFLSDNGPTGNYLMSNDEWWRRNPSGLNGLKGEVKDNGIKVPFFVRWRGKFQPASVKDALVSVEDLFPTLMDLAGAGWGDRHIDGKSLTPLLWNPYEVGDEWVWRALLHVGGPPGWTRKDGVYHLMPNWGDDKSSITWGKGGVLALRHGRYKYSYVEGMQRLYDMWEDPSERNPIWDWNRILSMDKWAGEWWNSLVWDYGSFSVPSFFLGWSSTSKIIAMGAAETSNNLYVKSHHVEGWVGAGTYAFYKVNILRTGCYRVSIVNWGGFQGKLGVKSSCNGEAYSSGHISWGGEFATLCIPNGGSSGCYLQLIVEYGEGWLAYSQLILQNS